MTTKGHNLTAEARGHVAQLRPVLDAENTHTQSVLVVMADVQMSGTEAGPEPELPVAHMRRPSRVVMVAAVLMGCVDLALLAYALFGGVL